ncbi:hypothetical protein L1049_006060 [Liquidambar formosana]|uniref:Protein NEOXANTHIN-DEFICIENT 1 n=1 Tax=Liquidambar formosana TaxID=63359 RepID=A0AAP0RHE3_LIQFO
MELLFSVGAKPHYSPWINSIRSPWKSKRENLPRVIINRHGYSEAGNALYQLHLVKSKTARAFIPKEFRLVEAFGYTLGGFFLASYDESPAGIFDELVVIAGIVWNPPTSCAQPEASDLLLSGLKALFKQDVGLPSQVARFSKRITAIPSQPKSRINGFLNMIGVGTIFCSPKECMDIQVTEIKGRNATDICSFNLTTAVPALKFNKWMGPAIKMSLPSFSGRTEYNPNLLKYSCQIECRVRAVKPARVSGPSPAQKNDTEQSMDSRTAEHLEDGRNLSISVLLSKPILALEFSCLKMKVEAPIVVLKNSLEGS